MNEIIKTKRTTVTLDYMLSKITKTEYTLLPGTTTTICQLFINNGYVILGTSACVDKDKYNKMLGEKYAYEDALNQLVAPRGLLTS